MLSGKKIGMVLLIGVMFLVGMGPEHCFAMGKNSKVGAAIDPLPIKTLFRTGTVKIIKPDGSVLLVKKDEPMPKILPGTKIEVITGALVMKIAGAIINIEKKEVVSFSLNSAGEIVFTAISGSIEVITSKGEKVVVAPKTSFNTTTEKISILSLIDKDAPKTKSEEPEEPEESEASPYTL